MPIPPIRVLEDLAYEAGVEFDPAFMPSPATVELWAECGRARTLPDGNARAQQWDDEILGLTSIEDEDAVLIAA